MIVEKARIALEKLRRTNYRQIPDFGLDETTELLISIIANECKSTVIKDDGVKVHGSSIIRDNIDEIVRQLVINGTRIPKEVMSKIALVNGHNIGVNSDIDIYKGIVESEDGSLEKQATISNPTINVRELGADVLEKIDEKIYKTFARQLVLNNLDKFPKQNRFSVFKERLFHRGENREYLKSMYVDILKKHTGYNEDIINNTVEYNLDYLYDERLKKEIIDSINNGASLVPVDMNKNKKGLTQLFEAVSAETGDLMNLIPDLNKINTDISQVYSDVEAQLVAYSTDITKLNPEQIEDTIKQINEASLKDESLKRYKGSNGYRTVNVGISGRDLKLLGKENVESAMKKLSKDIFELVQNSSNMSNEEYLKKAAALQYRFIRIHPFPDSNGRTSRGLLNMITIPKGMLINSPKNQKEEFTKLSNDTNTIMDEKGYLKMIEDNSKELGALEDKTEIPLYRFAKENCVIANESKSQSVNENGLNIEKTEEELTY